jgi:predicted PurR-regulated permease PerM
VNVSGSTTRALSWAALIGGVTLGFLAFMYALGSAFTFLVLAFFAAYFCLPAIQWLESKKIPRFVSLILIVAVISAVLALALSWIIPELWKQARSLLEKAPEILSQALDRYSIFVKRYDLPLPAEVSNLPLYFRDHAQEIVQKAAEPFFKSLQGIWSNTATALVWILNFFLMPVFFMYVMADYEKIVDRAHNLVPPPYRAKFDSYLKHADRVMAGYIRGQLSVCLTLAVLYSLGLWLINIPYGVLIGVVGGLLSFIPYLGGGVCLVAAILVAMATEASLYTFLGIGLVFSVVQSFESFYLSPRLVGNRVGLSSLAALLALIAGANLFGFWGLIIAIPVGGIMKVIGQDLLVAYKNSSLYRGG